jgi:hypothetical protein
MVFIIVNGIMPNFYIVSASGTIDFNSMTEDEKAGYVYLVCRLDWNSMTSELIDENIIASNVAPKYSSVQAYLQNYIGDITKYNNVAEIGAKLKADTSTVNPFDEAFKYSFQYFNGANFYVDAVKNFDAFASKNYDLINGFMQNYIGKGAVLKNTSTASSLDVMTINDFISYYTNLVGTSETTGISLNNIKSIVSPTSIILAEYLKSDTCIQINGSDGPKYNQYDLFAMDTPKTDTNGNYISRGYYAINATTACNYPCWWIPNFPCDPKTCTIQPHFCSFCYAVTLLQEIIVVPNTVTLPTRYTYKPVSTIDDSKIINNDKTINNTYNTYNIYKTTETTVTPSPSSDDDPTGGSGISLPGSSILDKLTNLPGMLFKLILKLLGFLKDLIGSLIIGIGDLIKSLFIPDKISGFENFQTNIKGKFPQLYTLTDNIKNIGQNSERATDTYVYNMDLKISDTQTIKVTILDFSYAKNIIVTVRAIITALLWAWYIHHVIKSIDVKFSIG